MIYLDFSFYLTIIVAILAVIWLVDHFVLKRRRRRIGGSRTGFIDQAVSLFPVLVVVWVIRSFLIQPYHVPTASLAPTVYPGDFILANQFSYGVYFPIWHKKLWTVSEPKRGDLVLFYWPVDPNIIFVKRVVGLPGDHIVYHSKQLMINGHAATQTQLEVVDNPPYDRDMGQVLLKEEDLRGIHHQIVLHPFGGELQDIDMVVPAHHYFMMGDNRDNSDDSRDWGVVSEDNLIGKALVVWMSWDASDHRVRWGRIGRRFH